MRYRGVVIAQILPPTVESVEAFGDVNGVFLFPEEELVIARAVERRRQAFIAGRACARRALAKLGLPPFAILPDERGAPQWPRGVVGSITHCDGYQAAAVAWAKDVVSVGIDAEPDGVLPEGVLAHIALPQEEVWLREFAALVPTVSCDRLLFSAKEALYKACYPVTHCWLNFTDALVAFDAAGTFDARLLVHGPSIADDRLTHLAGDWLARDGLLVTSVIVPSCTS